MTDIGPMKSLICELPIAIEEISGPNIEDIDQYHDDESIYRAPKDGKVELPGYDTFSSQFFNDNNQTQLPKKTKQSAIEFIERNVPEYIKLIL
jgi:hypothetical protein